MKTEMINFKIAIASFDGEAAKELHKARSHVRDLEEKIRVSFMKSERCNAISDIAGNYESGSKRSVIPRVNGAYIEADVLVDIPATTAAPYQHFNITEKTANLLLSGKLLTDDQKRALIKRMGFDIAALTEGA